MDQTILLSKDALAARYGVCVRTITTWMSKRILPYIKVSPKVVRFDIQKCDIALELYEVKSILDQELRAELTSRRTAVRGRE